MNLKQLRRGAFIWIMVSLAGAGGMMEAKPPATDSGESRVQNGSPARPLEGDGPRSLDDKMAAITQRLIPQIDAGSVVPEKRATKNASAEPDDAADLRPLYLRRHGISAGTRVEWVAPPPEKFKPAAANPEIQGYLDAAAGGNARAMTVLGLLYQKGEGVPQDLMAAHDWYLKAATKGDGDAINNLGVLYRDGFEGRKNPKIAYLIFLAAYRSGEGTEQTRARAQYNLAGLLPELSKPEIHEALSYTWPYVLQVLKSHGTDWSITPAVLPTKDRPRIRDNNWWQERERVTMTFPSPPPWDKVYN